MVLGVFCWNAKHKREAGFSLVETLLATVLLATGLLTTAQLFVIAIRANTSAQRTTFTATLAQQKMEQLRGLAWGFDDVGLPISDFTSDVTISPVEPVGGTGLSPSPSNALSSDVRGWVDFVDRHGNTLGGGAVTAAVPVDTVYVRRWSVEPLPTNPNNTLILQVLVFKWRDRPDQAADEPVLDRRREEARLVSVKTRKSR